MEVSAKTGGNIKEFFKDLAYMTAMGKKHKDEPKTTQHAANNEPNQNSPGSLREINNYIYLIIKCNYLEMKPIHLTVL